MSADHPTRDRLLDEAMRLFAAHGYASTTVADIQLACGLTAGSGALYKHFPSKYAVLEAGVRQYVATLATSRRDVVEQLPDNPREVLRHVVNEVWAAMDRDAPMLRIILRDLDQFPALREEAWQGVLTNVYVGFADVLRELRSKGAVHVAAPEATAAVLAASLTYYPILGALISHVPGDVPSDDFAAAWIQHAAASLGVAPASPALRE
ncbi:MAG: TetR/AcrR family transcriptional regulator [Streptosporangiaceae bacterium]